METSLERLQEHFTRRVSEGGSRELRRGTIVVVPSLTFPPLELRKISAIEHYEERLLAALLMLRDRAIRLIYVTSTEVDAGVVDYYLSFTPDPDEARSRLSMVPLGDPTARSLTEKLLESPTALQGIRDRVDQRDAFIFPFNVTELEQRLAEALRLPLFGPPPHLARWGTKSGARTIARRAGVPVLEGSEDLRSLHDLERAVRQLRARRPDAEAVVVKLDNGFSGQGNAIIDLDGLRSPIDRSVTVFCAAEESWSSFGPKIASEGAIVEEQVRGAGIVSPSVQLRILPGGSVELLSTHDQILGGPDQQVYLGCRFPARPEYRPLIEGYALKVAAHLADEGVIGLFGIDFVVVPGRDGYGAYLSEINLRVGGTTHPFLTAEGVTGGTYDPGSGLLCAAGRSTCYMATDNIKSEAYVGLTSARAIDAVRAAGLGYDDEKKSGIVLHMLGALTRHGKLGATCLAPTVEEAAAMHDDLLGVLDRLVEPRGAAVVDASS